MRTLFRRLNEKILIGLAFVVINTLVTVIAVGYHDAQALRHDSEEKAQALSHSLAALVHEKINSYKVTVDVISRIYTIESSRSIEPTRDLLRFAKDLEGYISLVKDGGSEVEVLLHTSNAASELPLSVNPSEEDVKPAIQVMRKARATAESQISDVYVSPVTREHMVAIFSPALSQGKDAKQLTLLIPAASLGRLLAGGHTADNMLSTLSDSRGNIVARSDGAKASIGTKEPGWYLALRQDHAEGLVTSPGTAEDEYAGNDLMFHRLDEPAGWYLTLAIPPSSRPPAIVLGAGAGAWAAVVFFISLMIAWAALGQEIRAAYVKQKIDDATRKLLHGLPGALLQIALPVAGPPRVIVSHGTLSADLAGGRPQDLEAVLRGAVEASGPGGMPRDVSRGGRTLRVFASGEHREDESSSVLDAYVLDVTELKRAEAIAASSARLATMGKIYASIAHEISQPLNIISLAAENGSEFLREGDVPSASAKFAGIVKQARQARLIVDRMLIFARGEPGPERLVRVDIESCLTAAREVAAPRLAQHMVSLKTRVQPKGLRVLATPLELEHVFLNLLLNAIHAIAGHASGGERVIEVRIDGGPAEAVAEIEDTGGGLDESMLAVAFEPFVTTKPTGEGTGLGLAFVRSAMESFRGKAEIANGRKGARVRLTFRLPPAHAG